MRARACARVIESGMFLDESDVAVCVVDTGDQASWSYSFDQRRSERRYVCMFLTSKGRLVCVCDQFHHTRFILDGNVCARAHTHTRTHTHSHR